MNIGNNYAEPDNNVIILLSMCCILNSTISLHTMSKSFIWTELLNLCLSMLTIGYEMVTFTTDYLIIHM